MKYEMYETKLDTNLKKASGRRALKRVFGKGPIAYSDFADLMAEDMLHSSTDFDNVIKNLTVLGLEKRWIESSSPVVFLENRELAQTLLRQN